MTTATTNPNHWTGAKYDASRDVKEIAADIRKDIKAAVKAEFLPKAKYSVRISRYSMGRSVSITVSEYDYPTFNAKRVAWDKLNLSHAVMPDDVLPWRSEHATTVEAELTQMANAYNYDRSDPMTDCYNSGFHLDVDHKAPANEHADLWAKLQEFPEWLKKLEEEATTYR